MPGLPAVSSSEAMLAAWPTHHVATGGRTYCIVSQIPRPAVTEPPTVYILALYTNVRRGMNQTVSIQVRHALLMELTILAEQTEIYLQLERSVFREFSTPPQGVNTPNFHTTPPASSPDNPLTADSSQLGRVVACVFGFGFLQHYFMCTCHQ